MELGLAHYDSSDSDNDEASTTQAVALKMRDEVDSAVLTKGGMENRQSVKRTRLSSSPPKKKIRSDKSDTISMASLPHLQESASKGPLFSSLPRETERTSMLVPPPNFDDGDSLNVPPPPPLFSTTKFNNSLQRHGSPKDDKQPSATETKDTKVAGMCLLPPQLQLKRPNVSTEDLTSYGYVKATR